MGNREGDVAAAWPLVLLPHSSSSSTLMEMWQQLLKRIGEGDVENGVAPCSSSSFLLFSYVDGDAMAVVLVGCDGSVGEEATAVTGKRQW